MKLPKELITVTPLSKLIALILFTSLPILFFFIGIRYERETNPRLYMNPAPIISRPYNPTKREKMQQPYGKVSISGQIVANDPLPTAVDGSPTLMVQIPSGNLFEIMLPSGESYCELTSETNIQIQSLKVGDTVEVYGTAATDDRIIVCYADEYVRISNTN